MQKKVLALFWSLAQKYPKYLIGIAVLLPVTILMHQFLSSLVIADMLQRLGNGDFIRGDLWGSFGLALILYAFLRVTSATIMWRGIIVMMWKLEAEVTRALNRRIFAHVISLSPQFHAEQHVGSLVAAATRLTESYTQLLQAAIMQFIPLILSFVFATVILLPKAPVFVGCLLAFAAVYITMTIIVTKMVRERSAEEAAARSKVTGMLADSLTNILVVKSFAAGKHETKRFGRATDRARRAFFTMMRVTQTRELAFSVVTSSITSVSIILAIASAVVFGAELATVFLIVDYTGTLVGRLWEFSNSTLRTYNRAIGNASDMITTLETQGDVADPPNPRQLKVTRGKVEFKAISFKYPGAGTAVFTNFSLQVKPGEKIGLVGHSGAGKSTLIGLLLRFTDTDEGVIMIDGQDIRTVAQDDLRQHLSYVPQEPLLFHRTIRENITYGRPDATEAEMVGAAKKARAYNFIKKLPKGFDTMTGERGVKLSGGERQRIAIARAILKDAPLLLLDEATSALDSESEQAIQQALGRLMQGKTTIAIAHRLSTIRHMDRIIVLKDGKIIEEGDHNTLLVQGGVYADLWKHQAGGFLPS